MALRRFTAALPGSPQGSPARSRLSNAVSPSSPVGTPSKAQFDAASTSGSPTVKSLGSTFNSVTAQDLIQPASPLIAQGLSSPSCLVNQTAGYRTPGALGKKTIAARILQEELAAGGSKKKTDSPKRAVAAAIIDEQLAADPAAVKKGRGRPPKTPTVTATPMIGRANKKDEANLLPWAQSESMELAKSLSNITKQTALASKLTKAKTSRDISGPVIAGGDLRHKKIKGQSIALPRSREKTVADIPFLMAGWAGNKRNKLIGAGHESIGSYKKMQWTCTNKNCGVLFEARIADQYVNGNQCPSCKKCPGAAVTDQVAQKSKQSAKSGSHALTSRNFNPELAKGWDKAHLEISDNERLFVSPKLDGIRCVAMNAAGPGEKPKPAYLSRRGHQLESCDHLNPLFEKIYEKDPEAVFDGELYNHAYKDNFDAMGGAVRCLRKHRTPEQEKVQLDLQFHCFGLMYGAGITDPTSFADRVAYLRKLTAPFEKTGMLSTSEDGDEAKPKKKQLVGGGSKALAKMVLVPQIECTKSSVDAAYQKHLKNGYEGLMVRFGSVPYQFGKRSKALLKVKPMEDAEYKIVGFTAGEGKWEGSLGAFICETKKGDQFRVTPKSTEELKAKMWKDRKAAIGQMMTVQYQALTPQGVPRFPIGKAIRGSADGKDWM